MLVFFYKFMVEIECVIIARDKVGWLKLYGRSSMLCFVSSNVLRVYAWSERMDSFVWLVTACNKNFRISFFSWFSVQFPRCVCTHLYVSLHIFFYHHFCEFIKFMHSSYTTYLTYSTHRTTEKNCVHSHSPIILADFRFTTHTRKKNDAKRCEKKIQVQTRNTGWTKTLHKNDKNSRARTQRVHREQKRRNQRDMRRIMTMMWI